MGIWVPFPLPNPNGCRDSGVQCPVAAGQTFTYQEELAIQSIFPSVRTLSSQSFLYCRDFKVLFFQINVVVKWILKDQDKNPVFCVIVPAKIVP
jgi:Niemann-Pick C2 protein